MKTGPVAAGPTQRGVLIVANQDHGTTSKASKQTSRCCRCSRTLTDPHSVARGMGPDCWAFSGGDVFERDLDASPKEWQRRERLLCGGGEIDLGANWQYIEHDPNMALQLPQQMRVSVRHKDGQFEAYGLVFGLTPAESREIVFLRSPDVKAAYAAAVQAGPASNASAHRIMRTQVQRARRSQRRRAA